jgi:hypothetical protein
MIKEYTFNTGVKPFDFTPPAGIAFMKGFRDSGNGVYVIPFKCEEVPKNYKFILACDFKNYPIKGDVIIRKIKGESALKSKYAYFIKN